uniref:Methyl-CpG-binding domain protein 4 n=1 Tax=Tetraselmis sp. GSL018 TaxID=582737 RepID=A0A061RBV6_9CHLO
MISASNPWIGVDEASREAKALAIINGREGALSSHVGGPAAAIDEGPAGGQGSLTWHAAAAALWAGGTCAGGAAPEGGARVARAVQTDLTCFPALLRGSDGSLSSFHRGRFHSGAAMAGKRLRGRPIRRRRTQDRATILGRALRRPSQETVRHRQTRIRDMDAPGSRRFQAACHDSVLVLEGTVLQAPRTPDDGHAKSSARLPGGRETGRSRLGPVTSKYFQAGARSPGAANSRVAEQCREPPRSGADAERPAASPGAPVKADSPTQPSPTPKHEHHARRFAKWTPPQSPYGLIQEQVYDDPWKVMLCCILLNKTSITQVRRVIWDLFRMCPTPEAAIATDLAEIEQLILPLGLHRKRARDIKRFSEDYLTKDWKSPYELHSVGKYAADAYSIFCEGAWRDVEPCDKELNKYHEWLKATDGFGTGLERDVPPL